MTPGMVIIGAGECGGAAAVALREQGYAGPITLVGREPHAPYERPPLSKQAITADDAPSPTFAAADKPLADLDITFLTSTEAVALDRAARTVRLADGRDLPYARLLLATGSRARSLPLSPPPASPPSAASRTPSASAPASAKAPASPSSAAASSASSSPAPPAASAARSP